MSKKHTPVDARFAALARLKARPAVAKAPAKAPLPAPDETPAEDDGLDLFKKSLSGVAKLKADGHAEVARPKPKAVPRPRAEPEPEPVRAAPPPDPRDPKALWRAAYQDVTPLADTGRMDLATVGHRKPAAEAIAHLELSVPEELPGDPAALFRHAMRGAAPLPETGRLHLKPEPPPAIPKQTPKNEKEVLRESLEAPITFEDRLDMGDEPAFLRPGLPRRVLTDLRKGRWVVQGELDLHGMTRDEAREALGRFLATSLQMGWRCLRLIHGQGHGSPGREPVLKHLSKSWLSQRDEILSFCQARPHEGGAGALLVLLKAGQATG